MYLSSRQRAYWRDSNCVRHSEHMTSESAKGALVSTLPNAEPSKVTWARLVDGVGGRDDEENAYYESAADPIADGIETALRRFRAAVKGNAMRGPEIAAPQMFEGAPVEIRHS